MHLLLDMRPHRFFGTEGKMADSVTELKREVRELREEVSALGATIERMERDIQALFDKWRIPPDLKAELERSFRNDPR